MHQVNTTSATEGVEKGPERKERRKLLACAGFISHLSINTRNLFCEGRDQNNASSILVL